jgi:hypothetical protein
MSTPLRDDDDEDLPQSDPSEHYRISNSRKVHFNITKWLVDNKEDQAVNVCFLLSVTIFQIFISISFACRTFFRL